jgi:hypothetical protein
VTFLNHFPYPTVATPCYRVGIMLFPAALLSLSLSQPHFAAGSTSIQEG